MVIIFTVLHSNALRKNWMCMRERERERERERMKEREGQSGRAAALLQ